MDAVTVTDLVVDRGRRRVLHGLSFAVPAGQVTGLLGPSGSGKTTLMRAARRRAAGALRARSPCSASRPAPPACARRVGYVTQAPSVYDDLTVRENVALLRRPVRHGRAGGRRRDRRRRAGRRRRPAGRATCPAVSGAGSRSPARWSAPPRCWCSTSRPSGSTRCCASSCGSASTRSAAAGTTLIVSSHVMDEAGRCDRLLLLRDGELHRRLHAGAAARRRPLRGPRGGVPQPGPRPRGGGGMTAATIDRPAPPRT